MRRAERIRDLVQILHSGGAASQQEIVDSLRSRGHDVTQATVSRDLRAVGAMKVPNGERSIYRFPEDVPRGGADVIQRELQRNLDGFALAIVSADSLVVVRTAPGHAQLLARAIDLAGLGEIVGSVAGDDTIFIATPDQETAIRVAEAWRNGRKEEEVAT
jgi:transcriptional regulator of arginine metabolism